MKLAQSLFDACDVQTPFAGSVDRQRFWFRQSRQRSDDTQVFLKSRRISPKPLLQNMLPVLENPPVSLWCEGEEHVVVPNKKTATLENEPKFTVVEDLSV